MAAADSTCMNQDDRSSRPSLLTIQQHLEQLAAAATTAADTPAAAVMPTATAAAGEQQQQQQGQGSTQQEEGGSEQQQKWDLGLLLQGLLVRFGEVFNYNGEAVAVNRGRGIIAKPERWMKLSK